MLICTGTGGPEFVPTPPETTAAWNANAGRPPQEFARATMPLSFRPGWTDEHPDEFEALLADRLEYPTPPECWRAQYDACIDWAARVTPVEQIEAPTLVVHGDADRVVPYENGVELARRIPGSRFETLHRRRPFALPRVARPAQPDGLLVPERLESSRGSS